jgi:hypothetical protein
MTAYVEVITGAVKWMPEGSGKGKDSEVLSAGESVTLEASDSVENLIDLPAWKKRIQADKNAPAVGSASSKEAGFVDGAFQITTDDEPILVREYYETFWREHLVTRITPLSLNTTETNAVTAALYGVTAAGG